MIGMLEIVSFVLGPLMTNVYLVGEANTGCAVIIDPAWDGELIAEEARRHGWQVGEIWLTHAHFDHIGGIAGVLRSVKPAPSIALHPADLGLYSFQGGAPLFGMQIEAAPPPNRSIEHGQMLSLGDLKFEVRHCPGHTQGHVVFYCAEEKVVFCGDVIFEGGIGRTDMPGGDFDTLIKSIKKHILSLPDETRLLSGHGGETSVGIERTTNPFLV